MLNHAQQEAVRVNGHALITACPGSGKTTVLKHRAAFLLRNFPNSILCGVTFTAEAASELDDRIRREVDVVPGRIVCGTFHSLCKRQLTRAGHRFVLVTDLQQMELIRRAWQDVEEEAMCTLEEAVRIIEFIKAQADPILPSPRVKPSILVYHRYQELLRQMGAMDFADLVVECVRGMVNGSVDMVRTTQGPVTHMLVDEFQDTDEVQLAWVYEHIRRGVSVTVVGDDDQSIYSFRSALGFDAMEKFRKSTGATHIALNLTYRCAREIITPAAKLISHNPVRVEKTLETANRDRGIVKLHRFNSNEEEIDGMLRVILLSGNLDEWGVLARTNSQLDRLEQTLVAEDIPYVRSGGTSFWDLKAPALFLGVCQSLGAGDMIGVDELLRRIGIPERKLAEIHKDVDSRKPGALKRFLSGAINSNPSKSDKLGLARKRLAEWMAMISRGETRLALEGLATFIGKYAKLYEKTSPELAERDQRVLAQCVQSLSRLSGNLNSRLVALRNAEKRRNLQSNDDRPAIRIMTLHASKGLEFERVWIMGCEHGVIPSRKAPIEEERRLFFVGMTRAKRHLHISYVRSDLTPPSIFIDEAGLR